MASLQESNCWIKYMSNFKWDELNFLSFQYKFVVGYYNLRTGIHPVLVSRWRNICKVNMLFIHSIKNIQINNLNKFSEYLLIRLNFYQCTRQALIYHCFTISIQPHSQIFIISYQFTHSYRPPVFIKRKKCL